MELNIFENEIIINCRDDKSFEKFLKENKNLVLEISNIDIRKEEKVEENNYIVESTVGEYLEEISHIQQLTKEEIEKYLESLDEEESLQKLAEGFLREVANIAFDYLIAGIDFLDLIQEGNIGVMKALDSYRIGDGDISEYIKLWVRREMILFIDERVETEKHMYKGYFLKRKEEVLEHEIVAELEEDEEIEHLPEEERTEVIEEKIKEIETLNFRSVAKKLSQDEENMLKRYYGLIGDKRESVFEIENDLELERGKGEELFEKAITKLSLGGGRSLKI